ncbi:MAG: hypothetical protein NTZ80_01570 [Patescibacteria group bacterium]|nr:hypothetical protein [Patescibacteria group bacterium]
MKTCPKCQSQFEITQDDLLFYDKISPIFNGKKFQIQAPTLRPDCRQQRRMAWRNERTLYSCQCGLCHKEIVSLYSPASRYPVYCNSCWWGDKFDPCEYGIEYNPLRSFLDQWYDLQRKIPRLALFNSKSENSDYSNHSSGNLNCYLVFASFDGENNYYCKSVKLGAKDMVDCTACIQNSQYCYECVYCSNCYELQFGYYSKNCANSYFLYDCIGCHDCYRCVGLRNKQYCFGNEQFSKNDYQQKIANLGSFLTLEKEKKIFFDFLLTKPHAFAHQLNCINCIGDELVNCNNCSFCFDLQESDNVKYFDLGENLKDTYDCYGAGQPGELLYEIHGMFKGYHSMFCSACFFASKLLYCDLCQNSQNLFGCVSLKHKEYCVLNKQYTKHEYEILVLKIIESMQRDNSWGEFLPSKFSPFGYNETGAQEYFPLTKDEALSKGFNWSDYIAPPPNVEKVITKEQMKKLSDNINDISDDILNWALTCEVSGKLYKIIKPELKFYREHNLPIPHRHSDQRHKDRISFRNPRKLWKRNCDKCHADIQTTYSPDRLEIVYCEKCYLESVY